MQQQDHSDIIDTIEDSDTEMLDEEGEASSEEIEDEASAAPTVQPQRRRFDWLAFIVALLIAAFFALTARFNSQPSPAYIPAAVFSATGCGLLVTALRKLRSLPGVGLLEAGLAGFGAAFLQFAVAFTYPDVFSTVATVPSYSHAFLITWGLVALFAVVLSLAGAAIGHLAFAPPRPLPARAQKQHSQLDEDDEDEEENENTEDVENFRPEQATETDQSIESESAHSELVTETAENERSSSEQDDEDNSADEDEDAESDADEGENDEEDEEDEEDSADENEEDARVAVASAQPRHSLFSYAITVVLLGLLPMMVGYVFAATYDFTMNAIHVDQISPALYPTLSLLSGLLPWRLAAPINLSSANGSFIIFTLLWRIPDSVLGNPNLFDVQALEAYLFNASGLALLLMTMYGGGREKRQAAPWGTFLFLEALLGLIIVLPASLWIQRGLEGVLQLQSLVAQLPTIQLLNPTLFALNLVTGALFCFLVGLVVRRQYQLWATPRRNEREAKKDDVEAEKEEEEQLEVDA